MPDHPSIAQTLLTGDVRRLTLRIAAPSLAAMLATGLCTLHDALLLSGESAEVSAAVGVCFPLITAQQAVGFTLGMGAGSHMSRQLGAGEEKSARQAGATALLAALVLGIALCAAGLSALSPLLRFLGAQENTLPHAVPYARLLLIASPFSCVGLVLSSLLRAQGKTAANMLAYVCASAAGAALSSLLVLRMGLGVLGVGFSLLAREALAFCLLVLAFFRTKGFIRPTLRDITLRAWVCPAILRSGLPTLLRQGASSLSGLLLSRVSAGFGPAALSGMGLAVRAGALVTSAAIGFGQGFSPVCAANYGAGRLHRAQDAYRFCMKAMTAALLAVGAAAFFFGGRLLALFHPQAEVADFALRVLRAQSAVFFCQGAVILMNMRTQAMGQTVRASLVATSRQGIFLIPLLLTLPRRFGETGLILCQSAADVLAVVFSLLVVHARGRRKTPPLTEPGQSRTMGTD